MAEILGSPEPVYSLALEKKSQQGPQPQAALTLRRPWHTIQESGDGHQGKAPAAGDGAGNVRTDGPTLPRDLKSNQIDAVAHYSITSSQFDIMET